MILFINDKDGSCYCCRHQGRKAQECGCSLAGWCWYVIGPCIGVGERKCYFAHVLDFWSSFVATGEGALGQVAEDLLSGLYLDNRYKTGDGVERAPQVEVRAAEAKSRKERDY